MSTSKNITIAIVTRRYFSLKKCLNSIVLQSLIPKEIIIIDNSNGQKIKKICLNFKSKINIAYYSVKKPSTPTCRNLAIKKCQTPYLAFTDDDCILDKNWLKIAYKKISGSKLAYIAGQSKPHPKSNYVSIVQYQQFKKWQEINIKHHFLNPWAIDTKNIVFNINQISKCHFDTNFKMFEDIDFGLQLSEKNLRGQYCPQMLLFHNEKVDLISAIKKNYLRGQYKAKITDKWGKYDNFIPAIPTSKNLIDFVLKLSFNLGYLKKPPYSITVVNNYDQSANSERLLAFYNFLKVHHYCVDIIDSQSEFEKITSSKKNVLIYGYPFFKYKLLKFIHDRLKINQSSKILFQTLKLRSIILHRQFIKNKTDFAIVQYPEDMMVILNQNRHYKTLYDSPTIYFRELELSNTFPQNTINSLKQIESLVYKYSDYVSFHWYSYFDLAKKYKLEINNPVILNWGCSPQQKIQNQYQKKSKIIHLGKLNSYWVNPKLIQNISQSTKVDIYSYETPNKKLFPHLLGFKGYLSDPDLLNQYQFGLISITKDDLRSGGFSAKYLLYLSYGLPILCPKWRRDKLLKSATIYYDEKNFITQYKRYSKIKMWDKKHLAAQKISRDLNWDRTLIPLLDTIKILKKNKT